MGLHKVGRVLRRRGIELVLLGSVTSFCATAGIAQMQSNQMPGQSAPGQTPGQAPGQGMPGQTGPGQMPGQNRPGTMPNDAGAMADRLFLHDAAEGGMAEVQLGQLAASKASNQNVKDFGQKMATDHSKLNDQMAPIAQSMGEEPPTKLNKKDAAEMKKLQGLSGSDFDKEYMSFMVKDHKKDVKDFQSEMNSTTNPELKSAVSEGEAMIRGHLMAAEKVANEIGAPESK